MGSSHTSSINAMNQKGTIGGSGEKLKPSEKWCSFGIGSAGKGTQGVGKTDAKDGDGFLSCKADLDDMHYYAEKYNISLGYLMGAGRMGVDKEAAMRKLESVMRVAHEADSNLMVYYTGHGFKDSGDWAFVDGSISFDDIGLLKSEVMPNPNNQLVIICDCCFSGHWVDECVTKCKGGDFNMMSSEIECISASAKHMTAMDRFFAPAFFRGSEGDCKMGQGRYDRVLSRKPQKSLLTIDSDCGDAAVGDANRCWFVGGHDWMAQPHSWRPAQ